MFDIDTVLELGDGYYDVTDSNLYQVLDDHGKLLGYVYVYEMYYTEDDEEFTHYDYHYPNGVRFDSDAWNY
jgi:hypothetical protein